MHIPDAYLSPSTEAVAYGAMAPVWFVAARRTRAELTSRQAPLLSIGAAFCFAVQMFNIPALGGTTAHALGAALLAILVGPWAAVLGLTLTLAIQALLFGDGGILSLGANCFDMAFVAPMAAFGVYRLLAGSSEFGSRRRLLACGLGAYAGTVLASLSAGILLGLQPSLAHDLAGHALYCPFGLNVAVPAMVLSHLLVAGPAEAIITVAAVAYLAHSFPELLRSHARVRIGQTLRLTKVLGWALVLTPLGLLAAGSAWGEWGAQELRDMVGYTPTGVERAHRIIRPLLPDYGLPNPAGKPWEVAGYLLSALVGAGVILAFTRALARRARPENTGLAVGSSKFGAAPEWMFQPNPSILADGPIKEPWLERTLLKMRSTVARAIASEDVARSPGWLQPIHPLAKTIGFATALLAVAMARSMAPLIALALMVLVLAHGSRVPLKPYLARVAGAVVFFGAFTAGPVALQAVTPGPAAFGVLGVEVSRAGLGVAAIVVLRLACGIGLALLWHSTTRWNDLLGSLRSLLVPRSFLASAALAYRYLFVLMEALGDMVDARRSRQVGAAERRHVQAYAGAGAAILFAKSMSFTEELHMAMLSRSFEGETAARERRGWTPFDVTAAAAGVAALTLVLVLRSGH